MAMSCPRRTRSDWSPITSSVVGRVATARSDGRATVTCTVLLPTSIAAMGVFGVMGEGVARTPALSLYQNLAWHVLLAGLRPQSESVRPARVSVGAAFIPHLSSYIMRRPQCVLVPDCHHRLSLPIVRHTLCRLDAEGLRGIRCG